MNSLKDHINLIKQQKKGEIIKHSEIIKEKLKYNKKESILRKFDDIDNDFNYERTKNNKEEYSQNDTSKEIKVETITQIKNDKKDEISTNDDISIDMKQIFARLREKNQPVTLFGESESQRYNRLLLIESGKYIPETPKEIVKLDYEEIELEEELKNIDEDKILFKNKKEWVVTVKPDE